MPENQRSDYFPETPEEQEILTVCALRFDGYKYEECMGADTSQGVGAYLTELMRPIVETLMLHEDENRNFAAFFGLQRFLGKWGGEYLTQYSHEHLALRFLFLHLYAKDVPAEFRFEEHDRIWRSEYFCRREECAALI